MKKFSNYFFVTIALVLALSMFGCSGRPDEQIQIAQKAMDQAKEQQASEFAANEWLSASQAWNDANSLVEKGKYGESAAMLLKAKTRFEKARDVAKGKRDLLIKTIQQNKTVIELRYKPVKEALSSGKVPPKAKTSLEESCKDIDQGIEKLNSQFNQKEYSQADYTAKTVMRQVYEAEKELQGSAKKK